jgi:DNA helicase-2/ATP-dependent DNA helicase PcrA
MSQIRIQHNRAENIPLSQQAVIVTPRPYLEALNQAQREAVETLDGPVLVLAGAGTGKTRALTTRIAHILSTGKAPAHRILAVTFTNRAAREMRERIGALIGNAAESMAWLGTFHSIGVRILRRHAELVGLKSNFTILDTDDQLLLIKQLLQADNIDPKRWPPRQLAGLIDNWKNRGITPDKVPAGEGFSFGNGKGAKLYQAYQIRLKELNAVDFGDLLLECLRLFQEHQDILAMYQKKFAYLLVDEYQDTNVAQYLWLRLLAQGTNNVCCVGDDDQSIYGWRGAEVDNILRFERDFPGAKTIRLEQNYRSTGHILDAASGLIANNDGRLGKTLFTDAGHGEKVSLHGLWDDEQEARHISDHIEQLQRDGRSLEQIAILVRASFQMRAFEDRFVNIGLPYRVIGGPRFYERAEIKDAIAYFEVVVNTDNDLKFERIVNTPRRGLGNASMKLVHSLARSRGISLASAATMLSETEEMRPQQRRAFSSLLEQIRQWHDLLPHTKHTELAGIILDASGYTDMWRKDKTPKAQGRLDNLKELLRLMEDFESMAEFLEHVALVMNADTVESDQRVSLMTLHSAKGLEFDHVFLPGWEEGLFPHQRHVDEAGKAGLEEERRLAYVGITRARKKLGITFTQNRRVHGQWQSAIPSRFIDELPRDSVTTETDSHSDYNYGKHYKMSQYHGNTFTKRHRASAATIEGKVIASFTDKSDFNIGDRVFHDKFGYGAISAINGNKLTVDFEKTTPKMVLDSFVEKH